MDWTLIPEPELSPALEASIRNMLVASFPDYVEFFSANSYWGSTPEYRLLGLDGSDQPAAHLEFGYRQIMVGEAPFQIAGIGAVAVHPSYQGKQVGKAMFAYLREHLLKNSRVDFGFLGCREEVVKFYTAAGFTRVNQSVYNLNPDSQTWETYHGPTLIMPVHKSLAQWESHGLIHLNGMPW